MAKYIIQKSKETPDGWVLTDTTNLVVIEFEHGLFNETQKVTFLENCNLNEPTAETRLAQVLRAAGAWVNRHHATKCFNAPHILEWSEDNEHLYLIRTKFPKWKLEIMEEVSGEDLRRSLHKGAAYLISKYMYKQKK